MTGPSRQMYKGELYFQHIGAGSNIFIPLSMHQTCTAMKCTNNFEANLGLIQVIFMKSNHMLRYYDFKWLILRLKTIQALSKEKRRFLKGNLIFT